MAPKRPLFPLAELPSPKRRKESLSSATETSTTSAPSPDPSTTSSVFTRKSDSSSGIDDPNLLDQPKMSFDNYYWGLPGNPKLLARSNPDQWKQPATYQHEWDQGFSVIPRKLVFIVGDNHPLGAKLENGLRNSINKVLATMNPLKWISVDYLRIGYNEVEEKNPVVVRVTVEEGQIAMEEAQRISNALLKECEK